MQDRNLENPILREGVPHAHLYALRTVFLFDKRVVSFPIDGKMCLLPFVVVLYLMSHPPINEERKADHAGKRASLRLKPKRWDGTSEVVWPTSYRSQIGSRLGAGGAAVPQNGA